MENYIGVLAMCILAGVLAAFIHMLVMDNTDRHFRIKNICFYGVVFYGIMSIVKTVLGEGEKTLFSSFTDMEDTTYLHYGIPLVLLALILPVMLKIILRKEKAHLLMDMFLSIVSFLLGIQFLIRGVINSYFYISVCCIAFAVSCVWVFHSAKKASFYKKEKTKERLVFILPVMLLWTVTVLVFEPNQLLLNSLDEFSIPYFAFLRLMLLEAAAFLAVYVLIGVFVLSDRQLKVFGTVIFALSVAGYIQGNFLNGEMLLMDGTVQVWSSVRKVGNGIVWLIIIAAVIFLNYNMRFRNICKKIVQIVCVYICLMQILSLIYMIAVTDFPKEENEFVLTTNSMLEIDEENNVIVFVLDWFDRQIMDDILSELPDFTKNLKDFTDYTNTTSRYAFTSMSIPYLLTGVDWEYGMGSKEYHKYAYDNSTFLDDILAKNYSLGVYTESTCVENDVKQKFLNYSNQTVKQLGYKKAFYTMNNASKYKMAPFAAKQLYFYTTDDIAEILVNSGEYVTSNDIIFHNMLSRDKLSVDKSADYDGAFRFYHLKGAHTPPIMNDLFEETKEGGIFLSQARGALKITYEYIEEMKRLGVYDNATIIITADHGQNLNVMKEAEYELDYDMTSTPILFVKLPHETHEDGPVVRNAPVSHTEFAATVINAVGGDYTKYGRTFAEIGEDEDRERVFDFFISNKGTYRQYVIHGNANEASSWSLTQEEN